MNLCNNYAVKLTPIVIGCAVPEGHISKAVNGGRLQELPLCRLLGIMIRLARVGLMICRSMSKDSLIVVLGAEL
jgi:hypothetical protein